MNKQTKLLLMLVITGSLAACNTSPHYDRNAKYYSDDADAEYYSDDANDTNDANAEYYETSFDVFTCYSSSDDNQSFPIHLIASLEEPLNGGIIIDDNPVDAFYHLDGLERRWDWKHGDISESSSYAILMQPNGNALYYKFMGETTAKASMILTCERDEELEIGLTQQLDVTDENTDR